MKVLIIEDSWEVTEAISLAFQLHLHEAQLVSTHLGQTGIEMAKSEAPDVVILDLGLPDIDGFAALEQIRLFSHVPILILTVRGEKADIDKGLELGANDYMVKPFKQLQLLSRVSILVTGYQDAGRI